MFFLRVTTPLGIVTGICRAAAFRVVSLFSAMIGGVEPRTFENNG